MAEGETESNYNMGITGLLTEKFLLPNMIQSNNRLK